MNKMNISMTVFIIQKICLNAECTVISFVQCKLNSKYVFYLTFSQPCRASGTEIKNEHTANLLLSVMLLAVTKA